LTGCVLWDFVVIDEKCVLSLVNSLDADTYSAKIENTILCSNVRIGSKAQIKDCEFGTGFEAKADGEFVFVLIWGRADNQLCSKARD
jgi:translation initiation factor eIF-2B subunit gamma